MPIAAVVGFLLFSLIVNALLAYRCGALTDRLTRNTRDWRRVEAISSEIRGALVVAYTHGSHSLNAADRINSWLDELLALSRGIR